jgi:hypothetical protein
MTLGLNKIEGINKSESIIPNPYIELVNTVPGTSVMDKTFSLEKYFIYRIEKNKIKKLIKRNPDK